MQRRPPNMENGSSRRTMLGDGPDLVPKAAEMEGTLHAMSVSATTSSDDQPRASGERVSAERLARMLHAAPRDDRGRPRLRDARFDRAVFPEPVSFEGVVFEGTARFDEAVFEADASFDGVEFTGTARFDRVTFRDRSSFGAATFGATLWFNKASVQGAIGFEKSMLRGDATFDSTEFRGDATFAEIQVAGDASFDLAVFASRISVESAQFRADASFERVICAQGLSLVNASFQGNVSFAAAELRGEVVTEGARFAFNPELPEALLRQRRAEPLDFVPRATPDSPSEQDALGHEPLVRALCALLDDRTTRLPLTIAVTAPWGMGKSSVMKQVEWRLRHPPATPEPYRRWATVSFPAWKYEQTERLWAALATEIYEQPQKGMDLWGKFKFRTKLERKRLGMGRFALKFGWPPLAAAAAVVAFLSVDLSPETTAAAGLSSATAVFAALTRYWGAVSNPFKHAIARYASRPDYESKLGFTSEADQDIRCLGETLCPHARDAVAVFVDDLDRCSSGHVVEVVEAMNQIFASEPDRRYVFVLGLDRQVVAASIRVAYRDTVAELSETSQVLARGFGTDFLAKLVQLSIALPPPDEEGMRALLRSVTQGDTTEEEPPEEEVQRVAAQFEREASSLEEMTDAARAPEQLPEDDEAVLEGVRRQSIKRIRDSPDVVEAEERALRFLERNPRQVKRFHNAFRLQLYVANEDLGRRFDFTTDQLHALAKWVAVRLRWPALADADDREPLLLTSLEEGANGGANRLVSPEQLHRLMSRYESWFEDADLNGVLFEAIEERRVSELPREAFLRVA